MVLGHRILIQLIDEDVQLQLLYDLSQSGAKHDELNLRDASQVDYLISESRKFLKILKTAYLQNLSCFVI